MKKIIIGMIIGIVLTLSINIIGASISSSGVIYNSKTLNTVLDDLYSKIEEMNNTGDASSNQILSGKTALVKGEKVTGSMTNKSGTTIVATTITESGNNALITIPTNGYYSTSSKISVPISTIESNVSSLNNNLYIVGNNVISYGNNSYTISQKSGNFFSSPAYAGDALYSFKGRLGEGAGFQPQSIVGDAYVGFNFEKDVSLNFVSVTYSNGQRNYMYLTYGYFDYSTDGKNWSSIKATALTGNTTGSNSANTVVYNFISINNVKAKYWRFRTKLSEQWSWSGAYSTTLHDIIFIAKY